MIDLKKLSTSDGRREYYKYDMGNPATLVHHQPPYMDPRFNAELKERYGEDKHGDQRIRIVWAGTERQVQFREDRNQKVQEYMGMKYRFIRLRKDIGCEYMENGKKVFVTSVDRVPEGATFAFVPHWDDLGIMKFAIEMKFTAVEMTQMGWYPEMDKQGINDFCRKNGQKYRAEPNPNGEYIFIHYIETKEGTYKDLEQADLDAIHYMFHRSLNETEAEFIIRREDEMNKITKLTNKQEDQQLTDLIANARVNAEKKLAKRKPLIFT